MAFKSKKDKFAILLIDISTNLKEAADFFTDYKIQNISDLKVFNERIKEFEDRGDLSVHEIIKELNNAFITPIEREDILHLAMSMDDVLDGLEHCAALYEIYSIVEIDTHMRQMAELICEAVNEINESVHILSTKKLLQIQEHTIKIKECETKCDSIHRESVKSLFNEENNPIRIMQYKEMYEVLEGIADYCQEVANTFETIIMKNA